MTSLTNFRAHDAKRNNGLSGLTGTLPTEFFSLPDLKDLWMRRNKLTGGVPTEIGVAAALSRLNVDDNSLNVVLPTEINVAPELERLLVQRNSIPGPLLTVHLFGPKLRELGYSGNSFGGTLPDFPTAAIDKNRVWRLQDHGIGGSVPAIWQVPRMARIFLDGNGIEGTIPTELGDATLTRLRTISLGRNMLTGSLPSYLGAFATWRLRTEPGRGLGRVRDSLAHRGWCPLASLRANDPTPAVVPG